MNKDLNDNNLAKFFSKEELTPLEKEELISWQQENPGAYKALEQLYTKSSSVIEDQDFFVDTEAAWQKVNAKRKKPKSIYIARPFYKWMAVAAAVAVLIGLAIFFYKPANSLYTLTSGANTIKTIHLADGSVITLNHNSSLEYHAEMAKKRNVKLSGEAFFEVAKDAAHPFVIETKNGTVKVLGTAFNVSVAGSNTKVNVRTGKVEISNGNNKIVLVAGEEGFVSAQKAEKSKKPDENFLAWKEKKLIFNETDFADVITALQEYYKTTITVNRNAVVNCKVTTTFTSETLTEALDELKLLLHFKYDKTPDGVSIYNIECN